jgi:cell division protein FtsI (penicillin-binding protein 3)
VDEPKDEIYGGEVAAPAFKEIAEYAMKMLGVPPTGPAVAEAPPPPPPREPEPAPPPVEQAARRAPAPGAVLVPSLAGLPARAAVRTLEALDLAPELDGSGRVVGQAPAAGRTVARGTRVRMTLRPAG